MKYNTAITGIGIVSPIGIGKDDFWRSILDSKPGFRPISLFDTNDVKVKIAGEIADFNPKQILNEKNIIDLDRAALLLSSSVKLALDDWGLKIDSANCKDIGISAGTTFGSLHSISKFDRESLTEGPRYVNPSIFPNTVGNSPASRAGIRFNIKGFNSTISTGMSAGLDALEYAVDFIKLGRIKMVIACAVEDLAIQTFLGFYKLGYLSGSKGATDPVSCPFDKRRNGIILSEGAVSLIVESLGSAKQRGAKIYCRIAGSGSSFDPARFYKYNPKGEGMKEAMSLALKDAKLNPEDIDCVFANANSTIDADKIEAEAIKHVFGKHSKNLPVTSIKSVLGETYSASGSFSLAAAIGAIHSGLVPQTGNCSEPESAFGLNIVTERPFPAVLKNIMINSFGPNGANTSFIISKP